MKIKQNILMLFVLIITIGMSGCGPGQMIGPTITPISTNTPIPTSTQTPSPTLTQTMEPSPTLTPTPTIAPPAQWSNLFENARLTSYDGFDTFPFDQWDSQSCISVKNGIVVFACTNGNLQRNKTFHEGEGIMLDIKQLQQTTGFLWTMEFVTGNWGTDDYRDFGIANDSQWGQEIHLMKGSNWLGYVTNWTKPNIWYRLAMGIGSNGRIAILVWERDNLKAPVYQFINNMGKDWAGYSWKFAIGNGDKRVVLHLDNYYEISFNKIN